MVSIEQGEALVRKARKVIEKKYVGKTPDWMKEDRGVFVTLHSCLEHELRGCIGITEQRPIIENLRRAAFGSAYQDPRFPPLSEEEFDNVLIEVSVLTQLEDCSYEEAEEGDGFIISAGDSTALFLPQVWDKIPEKKVFFNALCNKAGLGKGCWKKGGVEIFSFKVEAFQEVEPRGEVKRVEF